MTQWTLKAEGFDKDPECLRGRQPTESKAGLSQNQKGPGKCCSWALPPWNLVRELQLLQKSLSLWLEKELSKKMKSPPSYNANFKSCQLNFHKLRAIYLRTGQSREPSELDFRFEVSLVIETEWHLRNKGLIMSSYYAVVTVPATVTVEISSIFSRVRDSCLHFLDSHLRL